MMNKQSIGMAIAVLVSASVTAAPVANLKISGDIKPPTCMVNGNEQADLIYNLGAVSPSVIPQSAGYNGLPRVSNTLTVSCDAATYLTFKATDTYPNDFILGPGMNEKYKSISFNLVDANSPDKTVGGVQYRWESVQADGDEVYISRANDGGDSWPMDTKLVKGVTNGWTKTQQKYVDPAELELVSARNFSATFFNAVNTTDGWKNTYLLPKDELAKQGVDLSNGIDYISNVILTFNFGV
jgi:type 1 fimbria pilin